MISFEEMHAIARVKRFTVAAKKHAQDGLNSRVIGMVPTTQSMLESIVTLCDTLEWFIALIERETKIPCNTADVNIAEHLELVQEEKNIEELGMKTIVISVSLSAFNEVKNEINRVCGTTYGEHDTIDLEGYVLKARAETPHRLRVATDEYTEPE